MGLLFFTKTLVKKKKLEERQELFVSIVNSSDDAIISKTLEGIINSWNTAAEKIFGYTADEIIGKHISTLIPLHLREEEAQIMARIRAGKNIDHYETERIRKDGSSIDVSLTISPIKDAAGNITGASKILRDITERKKMLERLVEREEQLELFIEHSPASLAMFDREMRYITASRRWINDYKLEGQKLTGKSHYEIFPEIPSYWKDIHQRCLKGFVEKNDEELFIRADGSKSWIQWEIRPWHRASGEVEGIIIFTEEITARIEAEQKIKKLNVELEERVALRTEQLRKTNAELESFSYSVSHDLRAPLRIIDGFGQILMEDYSDKIDPDGQEMIKVIMNNAQKMGQLIDDLLNFSKIGRSEMKITKVDMNALVKEVIKDLKISGVKIPTRLKAQLLPTAKGDSHLLKQVWINLISNAIKYSGAKKDPVIEIGMMKEKGEDIYYVKDNGAGFDMKYADKLFGVFQRLHDEAEFSGTGVGLALVQRIILRHNGKIWAHAEENKGAAFYFTIQE